MNRFDLCDILEKAHKIEFAEYDNPPRHSFSLRHRIKMRKILSADSGRIAIKAKPRLVFVMLVILFLAVITAAVLIIRMNGFFGRVYSDNTQMFAFDTEGCPQSIEEIYQIESLPDGFEFSRQTGVNGDTVVITTYKSSKNDGILVLSQLAKPSFAKNYDNENYEFVSALINGQNGFVLIPNNSNAYSMAIWDNGDYIFEIYGTEDIDVITHSAESVKVLSKST